MRGSHCEVRVCSMQKALVLLQMAKGESTVRRLLSVPSLSLLVFISPLSHHQQRGCADEARLLKATQLQGASTISLGGEHPFNIFKL